MVVNHHNTDNHDEVICEIVAQGILREADHRTSTFVQQELLSAGASLLHFVCNGLQPNPFILKLHGHQKSALDRVRSRINNFDLFQV